MCEHCVSSSELSCEKRQRLADIACVAGSAGLQLSHDLHERSDSPVRWFCGTQLLFHSRYLLPEVQSYDRRPFRGFADNLRVQDKLEILVLPSLWRKTERSAQGIGIGKKLTCSLRPKIG